eukprot:9395579-Pyramimonas_sp.AAC.1
MGQGHSLSRNIFPCRSPRRLRRPQETPGSPRRLQEAPGGPRLMRRDVPMLLRIIHTATHSQLESFPDR